MLLSLRHIITSKMLVIIQKLEIWNKANFNNQFSRPSRLTGLEKKFSSKVGIFNLPRPSKIIHLFMSLAVEPLLQSLHLVLVLLMLKELSGFAFLRTNCPVAFKNYFVISFFVQGSLCNKYDMTLAKLNNSY